MSELQSGMASPGKRFYWLMSWRMLWRDWRGGELTLLLVSLVIAVTSITAVGFFTDRIERGLRSQSAELLAADLVIESSHSSIRNHIEAVHNAGLESATTTSFRSVVLAGDRPQLVEVKAVSNGYPLRGTMRISASAFGKDEPTTSIPAPGHIWVEQRLLHLLSKAIGDSVELGTKTFILARVIRYEPDRGGDLFSLAPRILMNEADLPSTGLIGVGARVKYRLLISGQLDNLTRFKRQLEDNLQAGERLLSVEEGRPELNSALKSARQYLGLAALISVMLAGVAVATVANRFSQRHLSSSAMFRCLGMSQAVILRLFLLEMLWLALLASSIGSVLGFATQAAIAEMLDRLILASLPPPGYGVLLTGYITGVLMLIGFALPPMIALKRVPPLHVLRRDVLPTPVNSWIIYLSILACMSLLLVWQLDDLKLVLIVIGGMITTLFLLSVAAYGLIALLTRLRSRVGVAWRYGLANIARRPASSVIQIVAFGLGIMVLLLLYTVRSDMLNEWQRSLPDDAPNHFIINIQPEQVAGIQQSLTELGVGKLQLYPMLRSRLVEINHQKVSADNYDSPRAKRLATREFNLSTAKELSDDNTIVSGSWWHEENQNDKLISIESGLAETLRIKVGDILSYDINGVVTDFKVSSLREVDWDTFNINFFAIVTPESVRDVPMSWITSVYLDQQQRSQLGALVKRFPNITIIDTATIMQRVRGIISRVSLAVEFIFLFTLVAGLAVLYAAIQSNRDERRFENAILRTLGAQRSTLLLGLFSEFFTLGLLSGALAGMAASSLALVLAEWVFKFDYQFDLSLVVTGIVSGIVIVTVAGIAGTYRVITHPPTETLRESAARNV